MACGEEHTCFVSTHGGHVYAMGSNQDGKLGVADKTIQNSNVPCLVDGLENIVKVSCGLGHSLALNEEGTVFTWG